MEEFRKEFDARMAGLRAAVAADRDDPFYGDAVVSQGERFSSLILAYVLRSMGHKSVALTSEDAGIVAVGQPMSGSADLLNTPCSPWASSPSSPGSTGSTARRSP